MALTATLDKITYVPGDVMVLTVKTDDGERDRDVPVIVKVSVDGLGEVDLTGSIDKPDASVVVSDSGRIWTKVSDDGVTAVFNSTAA